MQAYGDRLKIYSLVVRRFERYPVFWVVEIPVSRIFFSPILMQKYAASGLSEANSTRPEKRAAFFDLGKFPHSPFYHYTTHIVTAGTNYLIYVSIRQ